MSKSKIVDELVKATGAPEQKKGESNQDFLVRLHSAVSKMCDEEEGKKGDEAWEALSDGAQRWYNKATGPMDKKKELPLPTGVVEVVAKEEAAEEEAEPKVAKKKSKKAAKEDKAEKPAKAAKEKKGKKAKGKKDKVDKKDKKSKGRPRLDDAAVLVRKVKTLPEGNRNKYWDKVPAGTTFKAIRKNKTHFRVVRYWRRNGFVELKAA